MKNTKMAIVIGCRKLSLRKDPDVDVEKENSNVLDSEEVLTPELEAGTKLEVDTSKIYYDWKDREFYKVWTEYGIEGYAPIAALKFIERKEDQNGRRNKHRIDT